jgi:hypothetical protein
LQPLTQLPSAHTGAFLTTGTTLEAAPEAAREEALEAQEILEAAALEDTAPAEAEAEAEVEVEVEEVAEASESSA